MDLHFGMPLIAFALVFVVLRTAYTIFFGPLVKLPGPFFTRWSYLPHRYHVIRGQELHWVHSLHSKYGPVVRVAPDQACTAEFNAVREIHKTNSGYNKTLWYELFSGYNLFSIRDSKQHAERRKLMGAAFSETSLRQFESVIRENVEKLLNGIAQGQKVNGCIDMIYWANCFAFDILSQLCFSKSFGSLDTGVMSTYQEDMTYGTSMPMILGELPILKPFSTLIGRIFNMKPFLAQQRMRKFSGDALIAFINDPSKEKHVTTSLFSKLHKALLNGAISEADIRIEADALMFAGTETTSVSMSYILWCLAKHPLQLARLIKEARALPDDYSYEACRQDKSPFLDAVIRETLRLWGPASGPLPRSVPDGSQGGRVIAGHWLPAGTTIYTQAYTLHHDPDFWGADVDEFRPERWLTNEEDDEGHTSRMKSAWLPFSTGSRVCIGQNLAMMELRLFLVGFARRFDELEVATGLQGFDDAEMCNFGGYFATHPAKGRCMLRMTTNQKA